MHATCHKTVRYNLNNTPYHFSVVSFKYFRFVIILYYIITDRLKYQEMQIVINIFIRCKHAFPSNTLLTFTHL
jgi:hypothetical protein